MVSRGRIFTFVLVVGTTVVATVNEQECVFVARRR